MLLLNRIEHILAKSEIAHFEQFLLLSECFQNSSACRGVKKASTWGKGLNVQVCFCEQCRPREASYKITWTRCHKLPADILTYTCRMTYFYLYISAGDQAGVKKDTSWWPETTRTCVVFLQQLASPPCKSIKRKNSLVFHRDFWRLYFLLIWFLVCFSCEFINCVNNNILKCI